MQFFSLCFCRYSVFSAEGLRILQEAVLQEKVTLLHLYKNVAAKSKREKIWSFPQA